MTTSVPKVFKSTDAGAPQLTGQSGSLISILTACLIGTSGVAYGSGASQKAAVGGWTTPFTNTATKAVFRNSQSVGGLGSYHRILDDGSGAAGFKEAFLTSYQSMSTIDAGTNITPPTASMASGWDIVKSGTADSTSRPWILIADEVTCYFWIYASSPTTITQSFYHFGDIASDVPSDTYRYSNSGKVAYNNATQRNGLAVFVVTPAGVPNATAHGVAIGADYTLSGNSIIAAGYSFTGTSNPGSQGLQNPAPGTRLSQVVPVYIYHNAASACLRGRMRGLYVPMNNMASSVTPGNTYSASNMPAGTNMMAFINASGSETAVLFIDISNAWGL